MFNISSGDWTWVSKLQTDSGQGLFPDHIGGTGVPAGRAYSAYWISLYGELFIYGGTGGNFLFIL